MSIALKLFIDGVEVKKGDELIRGSNVITEDNTIIVFDRVNRSGEIVDSEGLLWNSYPDYNSTYTEWKRRSLIPKKYAPAIFVTTQNGKIIDVILGQKLESKKPTRGHFTASLFNSINSDLHVKAYWPASDYYKDGYYVLPEEDGE